MKKFEEYGHLKLLLHQILYNYQQISLLKKFLAAKAMKIIYNNHAIRHNKPYRFFYYFIIILSYLTCLQEKFTGFLTYYLGLLCIRLQIFIK